jgi:hypothetical protein
LRQNEGKELGKGIKQGNGGKEIESMIKGKELVGRCKEINCEVDNSS